MIQGIVVIIVVIAGFASSSSTTGVSSGGTIAGTIQRQNHPRLHHQQRQRRSCRSGFGLPQRRWFGKQLWDHIVVERRIRIATLDNDEYQRDNNKRRIRRNTIKVELQRLRGGYADFYDEDAFYYDSPSVVESSLSTRPNSDNNVTTTPTPTTTNTSTTATAAASSSNDPNEKNGTTHNNSIITATNPSSVVSESGTDDDDDDEDDDIIDLNSTTVATTFTATHHATSTFCGETSPPQVLDNDDDDKVEEAHVVVDPLVLSSPEDTSDVIPAMDDDEGGADLLSPTLNDPSRPESMEDDHDTNTTCLPGTTATQMMSTTTDNDDDTTAQNFDNGDTTSSSSVISSAGIDVVEDDDEMDNDDDDDHEKGSSTVADAPVDDDSSLEGDEYIESHSVTIIDDIVEIHDDDDNDNPKDPDFDSNHQQVDDDDVDSTTTRHNNGPVDHDAPIPSGTTDSSMPDEMNVVEDEDDNNHDDDENHDENSSSLSSLDESTADCSSDTSHVHDDNVDVVRMITLMDNNNNADDSPVNVDALLDTARLLRTRGKELHDEGEYEMAAQTFHKAASLLQPILNLPPTEDEPTTATAVSLPTDNGPSSYMDESNDSTEHIPSNATSDDEHPVPTTSHHNTTHITLEYGTLLLHEALCWLKADQYMSAIVATTTVIDDLASSTSTVGVPAALRSRALYRRAKAHVALAKVEKQQQQRSGDDSDMDDSQIDNKVPVNREEAALADARAAAFLGDGKAVALYGKLLRASGSSTSSRHDDSAGGASMTSTSTPSSSLSSNSLLESLLSKSSSTSSSDTTTNDSFFRPSSLISSMMGAGVGQKRLGGQQTDNSLAHSVWRMVSERMDDAATQDTICAYLQGTSESQLQQWASMVGFPLQTSHATKIANLCRSVTPRAFKGMVKTLKRTIYVGQLLRQCGRVLRKYRMIIVVWLLLWWIQSALYQPLPVNKRALRKAAASLAAQTATAAAVTAAASSSLPSPPPSSNNNDATSASKETPTVGPSRTEGPILAINRVL